MLFAKAATLGIRGAAIWMMVMVISCDRVKQTTIEKINKTGQTVAKSTSGFIDRVVEGVSKTFKCKIERTPYIVAKLN